MSAMAVSDRQALVALLEMLSLQQYVPLLVVSATAAEQAANRADSNLASGAAPSPASDPNRVHSIEDLITRPQVWQRVIKKPHHRGVLEGYLSVRQAKRDAKKNAAATDNNGGAAASGGPTDLDAAERRFQTFKTIKSVLSDLRELQLKKAQLDQRQQSLLRFKPGAPTSEASLLQKQWDRLRKPTATTVGEGEGTHATTRKPEQPLTPEEELAKVQDDLEQTIAQIDSAKDRLEVAQELLGFATSNNTGGVGAAGRANTLRKAARPGTAPSFGHRPAGGTTGAAAPSVPSDAFDPNKTVRPWATGHEKVDPNLASVRSTDSGPEPVRKTAAPLPPARPFNTTKSTLHTSNTDRDQWDADGFHQSQGRNAAQGSPSDACGVSIKNRRHQTRVPTKRDVFADVDFGPMRSRHADAASDASDEPDNSTHRPDTASGSGCHGASRANSIGPGWYRNLPRTRSDVCQSNRVLSEVARRQQRAQMALERELQLEQAVAAALQTESAEAMASRGFNKRQPPTDPAKVAAGNPTKRSVGTASFRPKTASSAHRGQSALPATASLSSSSNRALNAALAARARYEVEQTMAVSGVCASTVTLGVDLPLDHGAQMRFGAILHPVSDDDDNNHGHTGPRPSGMRPGGSTKSNGAGLGASLKTSTRNGARSGSVFDNTFRY
jgi:hypothetical protein